MVCAVLKVHDADAGHLLAEKSHRFAGAGVGQLGVGGIAIGERLFQRGDDLGLGFGRFLDAFGNLLAFGRHATEFVLAMWAKSCATVRTSGVGWK